MIRIAIAACILTAALVVLPVSGQAATSDPWAPVVTQFGGGGGLDVGGIKDALDRAGISERDIQNMVDQGYRALSDTYGRPIRNFNDLAAAAANLAQPFAPALSRQITAVYEQRIERNNERCGRIARQYRVSCMRDRLGEVARALPQQGEYAPMRAELEDAVRQLDALERANRQPGAAATRAQFKSRDETVTTGPLVPLRPEAIPAVHARASSILEETQTRLLRSGENSRKRAVHFRSIADALESGKLLLRAA